MDILEKNTDDLMKTLKTAGASELRQYLGENFREGEPDFPGYMELLFAQKKLKRQDILMKANLPQKYGYRLLTGEAHTTDRDRILRICFAMELTLQQTQRALKLYGMSELYPKVKRDVLLIAALGRKIFDIDRINEMLLAEKEAPLYDSEGGK